MSEPKAKDLLLTAKEQDEVGFRSNFGNFRNDLLKAQLLKAADWIKNLEHEDSFNQCYDHDCSSAEIEWLVDKFREAAEA